MIHIVVFVAGQLLVALVAGIAILVRDEHIKSFKDKVNGWYEHVDGDWDRLIRWVARANEQVLSKLLGKRIFSRRFLLSATCLSAFMSVGSLIAAVLWVEGMTRESLADAFALISKPMVWSGIILNCTIDVTTLSLARWAFRLFDYEALRDGLRSRAEQQGRRRGAFAQLVDRSIAPMRSRFVTHSQTVWLPLTVALAAFYVPGVIAALMWMVITQDRNEQHIIEAIFWPVVVPFVANHAAAFVIVLPATYSSVLFMLGLFFAAVVDKTRQITRAPIVKAMHYFQKEPYRVWFVAFVTLNAIVNIAVAVIPPMLDQHDEEIAAVHAALHATLPRSGFSPRWASIQGTWHGDDGEKWDVTLNDGRLRFATPEDHQSIHTAWSGQYDEVRDEVELPAEQYGSRIRVKFVDALDLVVKYDWNVIGSLSEREWKLRRNDFSAIDGAISDVANDRLTESQAGKTRDCDPLRKIIGKLYGRMLAWRLFADCEDAVERLRLIAADRSSGWYRLGDWDAVAGSAWPEQIAHAAQDAGHGRFVIAAWRHVDASPAGAAAAPPKLAIVRNFEGTVSMGLQSSSEYRLAYAGRFKTSEPECAAPGKFYRSISLACVLPREDQESVEFYEYAPGQAF